FPSSTPFSAGRASHTLRSVAQSPRAQALSFSFPFVQRPCPTPSNQAHKIPRCGSFERSEKPSPAEWLSCSFLNVIVKLLPVLSLSPPISKRSFNWKREGVAVAVVVVHVCSGPPSTHLFVVCPCTSRRKIDRKIPKNVSQSTV